MSDGPYDHLTLLEMRDALYAGARGEPVPRELLLRAGDLMAAHSTLHEFIASLEPELELAAVLRKFLTNGVPAFQPYVCLDTANLTLDGKVQVDEYEHAAILAILGEGTA